MEARRVEVDVVGAFYAKHPHPNVLEPLEHAEEKRFVALFDGDVVVAAASLQQRPFGFDQLAGVLVDPARQGEGLGAVLMDAIRAESQAAKSRWMVCGVYRRDPDVSPYYRRMGFRTWIPFIPGTGSRFPAGSSARLLAAMFRVAPGPDAIRIMARRP